MFREHLLYQIYLSPHCCCSIQQIYIFRCILRLLDENITKKTLAQHSL